MIKLFDWFNFLKSMASAFSIPLRLSVLYLIQIVLQRLAALCNTPEHYERMKSVGGCSRADRDDQDCRWIKKKKTFQCFSRQCFSSVDLAICFNVSYILQYPSHHHHSSATNFNLDRTAMYNISSWCSHTHNMKTYLENFMNFETIWDCCWVFLLSPYPCQER